MEGGESFRFKDAGEGEENEGDKVGGKPVGLAKSGKGAVLDVLDPDMGVKAKVLKETVDGDEAGGA